MRNKISIFFTLVAIFSCKKNEVSEVEFVVDGLGRRLVGPGVEYVPTSIDAKKLADDLNGSMQKRRKFAWNIVQKVTENVRVPNIASGIPLWMTWYSPSEIKALFDTAYNGTDKKMGENGFYADYVSSIMKNPDVGKDNLKEQEFAQFLARVNSAEKSEGPGAISGINGNRRQGFTSVSPAYVQHILKNYIGIANCNPLGVDKNLDLMSQKSFSPCMPEFPRQAVMIKTSWEKVPDLMDNFDLSAEALAAAYAKSLVPVGNGPITPPWPRLGSGKVPMPLPNKIFRIKDRDGSEWALRAIHIVTKEIREWVWITLSWSPNPDDDFGQDRPASITAPWSNYKMMVVTSFEENDATPYIDANGKPLLALKAVYDIKAKKEGQNLTTWASDPHIEIDDIGSNCIGCHGMGPTRERKNFPNDFSFLIFPSSSIDISEYFKNIISGKTKSGRDHSVQEDKSPNDKSPNDK